MRQLLHWRRRQALALRARPPCPAAIAAIATAGVALAACGNGGPSATTSTSAPSATEPATAAPGTAATSSTTLLSGAPSNGTYANGPTGTPHSYVTLKVQAPNSVSGTVNFVYQDGRTSTEFSFTGTLGGGQLQLSSHDGGPSSLVARYAGSTLVFQGCTTYMRFVPSDSQCTFTLTAALQ